MTLLIFARHLMTDPKSRKVIVIENTFMPSFVKQDIARTLFDNLKVSSVSAVATRERIFPI